MENQEAGIEVRLAAVERELANLKQKVEERLGRSPGVQAMIGIFDDDPDFGEVVKLGAQYRKQQTPETHG
jgi:hypothetical protein